MCSKKVVDAKHLTVDGLVVFNVLEATRDLRHDEAFDAQDHVEDMQSVIQMVLKFIHTCRYKDMFLCEAADSIAIDAASTIRCLEG